MDLFVLAFVVGFALASLIFWPLLYRSNQQLAAAERNARSSRPGDHGRQRALPVQPITTTSRTATKAPIASPTTPGAGTASLSTSIALHEPEGSETRSADADTGETEAVEDTKAPPKDRSVDTFDVPTLPIDLFEQHYEAKFERARKRLAKLRAQLDEQEP